jgi:hypothetical protein
MQLPRSEDGVRVTVVRARQTGREAGRAATPEPGNLRPLSLCPGIGQDRNDSEAGPGGGDPGRALRSPCLSNSPGRAKVYEDREPLSCACPEPCPTRDRSTAVASTTSASRGRRRSRRRRRLLDPKRRTARVVATGLDAASASARTRTLTTSVASLRATGVEAVHTSPAQWLNTTVDVSGCQVTCRWRSTPRQSGTTARLGDISTTGQSAPSSAVAQRPPTVGG